MKKCLLIGRHSVAGIEGHEVVEHIDILFPAHSWACVDVIKDLIAKASSMNASRIIFQALPGQANVALWEAALSGTWPEGLEIGSVIIRPGLRSADVIRKWNFGSSAIAAHATKAIKFANPNANVTQDGPWLIVTVTAPMKFEFSHIEWMPRLVAKIEVEGGVASATNDTNVAIEIADFDCQEDEE